VLLPQGCQHFVPRVCCLLRARVGALGLVVEDQDGSAGVGEHGPFVPGETALVVEHSTERDTVVVLWRIPGIPDRSSQ